MEKKQYELCLEILRRFRKAGILDDLILIGSWSAYFYRDYFSGVPYLKNISLKTRDMDFFVYDAARIKKEANVPELLKDLGFVVDFKGKEGYIKLDHPDLILEFLVQEKGRGTDRPYSLPRLGMNATALRFLNLLSDNTISVKIEDLHVTLPHPANFALHKLIVSQRRDKEEKAAKDRLTAIEVLKALIGKGESGKIKQVFDTIPEKWQNRIVKGLKETNDNEIISKLGIG